MSTPPDFASQTRVALPGSEKPALSTEEANRLQEHVVSKIRAVPAAGPAAAPQAGATPTGEIEVSVIVRRKQPLDTAKYGASDATHLTHQEFADAHGADPESVQMVNQFAAEFGLTVVSDPAPGRRSVHLSGTVQQMETAFGVKLGDAVIAGQTYHVREGSICLPEQLIGHVTAVLGLDNRPQAKPHNRRMKAHLANVSYSPVQVGELYGFPKGATAEGQTIAILELGGGFVEADLTAYFGSLGLPVPSVTAVLVDKGKNAPGDPNGADGEVMLDIEVCAAIAPGAKIVVYFAPNTDQGFIDAIATAVHDTTNNPSVLSISWGGPESTWTGQATAALDEACQSAAALGVTITVAAGDDGSTDGVTGSANHVDFPASSPHVLACGGTKLTGSGTTIKSEVVWNELANNEGATGGGVSTLFAVPTWQANSGVPKPTTSTGGRGVPDVAGDADPSTGYTIRVDGQTSVIGGTSAVAPLWAGLVALANAANSRRAGFINPTLYAAPAKSAFRDITSGNNGGFSAGPGWDPCTGLGSPVGDKVIALLAE